jgi:hypothetical protein
MLKKGDIVRLEHAGYSTGKIALIVRCKILRRRRKKKRPAWTCHVYHALVSGEVMRITDNQVGEVICDT